MEQNMRNKVYLDHDIYKELLIKLAERDTEAHYLQYAPDGSTYVESPYIVTTGDEEHYTEEAQELFNQKYDEIEELINKVGIFSKFYLENNL